MTLHDLECIRRLELPGKLPIVMVILKKGRPIDQDIEGLSAMAAVTIAKLLFETGHFEYIRVFGPDSNKVIDYSLENVEL